MPLPHLADPLPPPYQAAEQVFPYHAGSLPGDQPPPVFGWLPGELQAQKQIAAMSYDKLVRFAGNRR